MSLYTRCSQCKKDKYTNSRLFALRQAKYPEAETIDEENNTILINSDYICQDCKKIRKEELEKEQVITKE